MNDGTLHNASLLRLLQLSSPALPIGAFAFSQGLESAVALGWIRDEATARDWLEGTLGDGLARLDLPVFARLYRAYASGDEIAVRRWSSYLLASRESRERRLEDEQLARALARLLVDQGVTPSRDSPARGPRRPGLREADAEEPHAAPFALAAVTFSIPLEQALLGFAFSWAENQVGALARLMPLGQLAAQRVLTAIGAQIPGAVAIARTLSDAELGSCLPGVALASALHETQYSRLFKS
jgi:urease accessory protein